MDRSQLEGIMPTEPRFRKPAFSFQPHKRPDKETLDEEEEERRRTSKKRRRRKRQRRRRRQKRNYYIQEIGQ